MITCALTIRQPTRSYNSSGKTRLADFSTVMVKPLSTRGEQSSGVSGALRSTDYEGRVDIKHATWLACAIEARALHALHALHQYNRCCRIVPSWSLDQFHEDFVTATQPEAKYESILQDDRLIDPQNRRCITLYDGLCNPWQVRQQLQANRSSLTLDDTCRTRNEHHLLGAVFAHVQSTTIYQIPTMPKKRGPCNRNSFGR